MSKSVFINQNTKDFILNKYKIINLVLLLVVSTMVFLMDTYRSELFVGKDIKFIYDYHDAIYQPLFNAGKVLIPILALLLLFPGHCFRQWLFFVLPVPLILTLLVVSNISVHTSSITVTPRYLAAEYGMRMIGMITLVSLSWMWWKNNKRMTQSK